MNKIISVVFLVITMFFSKALLAQEKELSQEEFYVGINLELISFSVDYVGTFTPSFLTGKLGKKITDNFSVEGKLGLGMSDSSVNAKVYGYNAEVTLEPKTSLGVFAIASNNINDGFEIYAKGGLNYINFNTVGKLDGEVIAEESTSEMKLALGTGANFYFNKNQGINLEVFIPSIGDLNDIVAFSFGYIQNF